MSGGDLCPKCSGDSGVFDSRRRADGNIARRRECKACGERWSTIEIPLQMLRRVKKADALMVKLAADLRLMANMAEAWGSIDDADEAGE